MFDATERCDECGAQAWVESYIGTLPLLHCGHHFTKHEAKLRIVAIVTRDHRNEIL